MASNVHNIELFFYIKGSKDYPTGQLASEPFGYDKESSDITNGNFVSNQTAIFNTSIRDLYLQNTDLMEVSNIYSLDSDKNNNISTSISTSLNGITTRTDGSPEYLSTMLIRTGTKLDKTSSNYDEAFKFISPNYAVQGIKDLHEKLTTVPRPSSSEPLTYNIRTAIFWQKVFTLLEFLKKNEAQIVHSIITGDNPEEFVANKSNWYATPDKLSAAENLLNPLKENSWTGLTQYLALFLPYVGYGPSGGKSALIPSTSNGTNYVPFRASCLNTELLTIGNTEQSTEIYRLLDHLWDSTIDKYGGYDIPGLSIRLTGVGEISCSLSKQTNRLSELHFSLGYVPYSDGTPTTTDTVDVWNFDVYFDPDSFINKTSTLEQYPVWTYNDDDMDNNLTNTGDKNHYDYNNPNFNIYDNDYSNLLSSNGQLRGKFVATNEEIAKRFVKEVLSKTESGGYRDYYPYETKRVSPYIDDNGTVVWDDQYSTQQRFYVFYKGAVAPENEQAKEAVKDYLRKLHQNCNPETVENDRVLFIGHGHSSNEIEDFLANMYPDLFSKTEIFIIPPDWQQCTNGLDEKLAKYGDPDSYFVTATPQRIYDTMIKNHKFTKFILNPNGVPSVENDATGTTTAYPVEIFYIGSIGGNNVEQSFRFGFPWIACSTTNPNEKVLTSLNGMADYRPKFFTDAQSADNVSDILQYIIIRLCEKMFEDVGANNPNKQRYTRIKGINILYDTDKDYDANASTKNRYSVAKFTVNKINFTMYSQKNKDFGSSLAAGIED